MAGAPRAAGAQFALQQREVPFVTLRNRTGSADPARMFGDARSTPGAGWCRVRELDLSVLAPLAAQVPPFIREDLLRIEEVRNAPPAVILDTVSSGAGGPVIYVHGYYTGFEKGCQRAVLLQRNAGLAGRFMSFSWPSDGALASYPSDEADLYWSLPDLVETIVALERRAGSGAVDVMGHSLGARGVVLALHEIANRYPDIRLNEVVLLAPDVDFGIFQRLLPRIAPIAEGITVYVTQGDRPLAVSAQLHGYPRLGEVGNDVASLAGVEVIDLSDVPAESFSGHVYHVHSAPVGRDLDGLLNGGLRAADRENLVRVGSNLWRLRPAAP